jgi:bleomycin hydrolase
MGIDVNNYIEITSYTNMPYYEASELIIPDNWSHDNYYNLPLDEFIEVMEYSLNKGYTFVWDGDMSDKGFSRKTGIAIVEAETAEDKEVDKEQEKSYFKNPIKEKHIDAESRQAQFENFNVTDDHLMHITGIVKDQNGVKYYKTKNSWGVKNKYAGYWNMSEEFMRLHTVAIMVHKDAVPKEILKKLNLK